MKTILSAILAWTLVQAAFAQTDTSPSGSNSSVSTTVTNGSLVPIIELKAIPGGPPGFAPVQIISSTNAVDTATEHPRIGQTTLRSIQPAPYGAHAEYGLHSVDWQSDISDSRPIQITTPHGQVLSFAPTFLAIWDSSSGHTYTLAQITNRIGNVILPGTVLFTNAFDTLEADVRYTYDGVANSLEQDIILHEFPKHLPQGWSPENVRIQVWTAWFDSNPLSTNAAAISLRDPSPTAGPVTMDDSTIDFSTMKIVAGSGFDLQSPEDKVPVAKSWLPGDQPGVSWLVETIDYLSSKDSLDQLPQVEIHFSVNDSKPDRESLLASISHRAPREQESKPMLVAEQATPESGVVLDFVVISAVPVPAGIISWWPAGGNALDAVYTNNGILAAGAGFAAGKVGQAFSFNGTNQEVQVLDSPSLSPTNAVTLEGWIFPTRYPTNSGVSIAGKDNPYSARQYLLGYANVSGTWVLRAHVGLPGGLTYFNDTTPIVTNTWYHVAMTYDGSYLRVYVNGQASSYAAATGPITTSTDLLYLGGSVYADINWYFPGLIDEFSVYSRALSLSEIQSIYNAGGAGKRNQQQCVMPSTNAVGWWAGDGTSNDLAHINFGTLVSGATYASARVAQGFSFNGTSSYFELTNAPELNPTNAITLEAWVYQTTNLNQNQPIFSKDDPINGGGRQYILTVSDQGKFRAHIGTPYGFYYFDSTNLVTLNTWYHVAMTYDWSYLRLYVNGVVDSAISVPGGIIVTTNTLRLGGSYSGSWGNYKFGGIIDEATVYNRALSGTEISAIYSAGGAGKCKVDAPSGLTYLQALFLGTNPNATDSDGDGISDSDAIFVYHISPLNPWLVEWGTYTNGRLVLPPVYLGYVAKPAGGLDFSVALLTNGTVTAWGSNEYGQTNVPANLTNVVSIAADGYQALALRADGSVTNWGKWYNNGAFTPTLPSGLANVVGIAAGVDHDIAVKADGTVVVWGYTNEIYNTVPSWLSGVKAVAAGYTHNVALLTNSTVVSWGMHWGDPVDWFVTNVPPNLTSVIAVAAGEYHTLALKNDGTVVAWGAGWTNPPYPYWADYAQSMVPSGLSNVVAIAAGGYSSLALRSDGTVVAWGQLGAAPQGLTHVSAIGGGDGHLLAERPGWETPIIITEPPNLCVLLGQTNTFMAVGMGPTTVSYQWQFSGANIAGATTTSLTVSGAQLTNQGNYHLIVSNGAGSTTSQDAVLNVVGPPGVAFQNPSIQVLYGSNVLLSVIATNTGYCSFPITYAWTFNGSSIQNGVDATNYSIPFASDANVGVYSVTLVNGGGTTNISFTVDVAGESHVIWWGSMTQSWNYLQGITNIMGLAGGGNHALLVEDAGIVIGWGSNNYGQTNVPAGLTNAIAVAAGDAHSLALRSDGSVVGWGRNDLGQTTVPSIPTNVIAISAGGQQSLALTKDGRVFQWGLTTGSIPSNTYYATMAIAAGTNFSLALLTNGNVVAWGNNSSNQTTVPSNANGVVAIAAGGMHALALRTNGAVAAWGSNGSGESTVPSTLTNIMSIEAGYSYSLALSNNGTIAAWGNNSSGQTNVPLLSNVKVIAAGGYQGYASVFSTFVQYPVNVSRDLLVIYNTSSTNSSFVENYYLTNRPGVSAANILPVSCPSSELIAQTDFGNDIITPLTGWLSANPTKRPTYVILFFDLPQQIQSGNSVAYALNTAYSGWQPLVTSINMSNVADCVAYINKLTNFPSGQICLSGSAAGYGNTNYYFDGSDPVRGDTRAFIAAQGVTSNGVPASAVDYVSNIVNIHITSGTNVAGYWTFGTDGLMTPTYSTNVVFRGNSDWYVMGSVDSLNGFREYNDPPQCYFLLWFLPTAFGGTNYSSTPIGAVCHTQEPYLVNVENTQIYFGLWAAGKYFANCAWSSRQTPFFQAVGDPFVRQ